VIKIVSGSGVPGGSAVALANLCNEFNSRGIQTVFYAPGRWHLDKCISGPLSGFCPERGDTVIVHGIRLTSGSELHDVGAAVSRRDKRGGFTLLKDLFLRFADRGGKPGNIRMILTWRGDEPFPFRRFIGVNFDKIHFPGEGCRPPRDIGRPCFVCPDFVDALLRPGPGTKPENIAGVIGSIREENRPDLSIERAIRDGMKPVVLFGYLADPVYYYSRIEPLTRSYPGKIQFAGFLDDKQEVYRRISDVYRSAGAPWDPVRRECLLTDTRYHGPDPACGQPMGNDDIFSVWKRELGL
jgi:hypothetical protein